MATVNRHATVIAGWGFATTVVAACAVVAIVCGAVSPNADFPSTILTQSTAWLIVMPPALALALGVALWNRLHDELRLARWTEAACMIASLYWLAPAVGGALANAGQTTTWGFAVLVAFGVAGWTAILTTLQLAALVAAEAATGRRFPRSAWLFIVVATALILLSPIVLPAAMQLEVYPATPTLFAESAILSPGYQAVSSLSLYLWMVSVFVAPVTLWVAALRTRGAHRRALARVAVAAMMPGLMILLCGVLAAVTLADDGNNVEVAGLAVGLALALPATLIWLAATVHDAKSASARLTSIGSIVRVVMWTAYILGVAQTAAPLAAMLGTGPGVGSLTAIALLAVTFVPWRMLVAWCARKVDPRAAIAAAVIVADSKGAPAQVAERALREALGEPEARLLVGVAREGTGEATDETDWYDSHGARTPTPPPSADDERRAGAGIDDETAILLTGSRGRTIGALVSRGRFIDIRPLLAAVRALVERASLEAEVRAAGERVTAERHRADAAATEARRSIERDLHDGVQGRLVSLGLGLSLASESIADPVSRGLVDETVRSLRTAVVELRELSSGSVSARLTDNGLAAAVGDLVSRMPVAVELDIQAPPLGASVESTVYFVIAEALANVLKHAAAGRATVSVSGDRDVLIVVSDDGVGGADLRAGTGLRGLQERVHAVGGRLVVSEVVPSGTRVEALLPCGS